MVVWFFVGTENFLSYTTVLHPASHQMLKNGSNDFLAGLIHRTHRTENFLSLHSFGLNILLFAAFFTPNIYREKNQINKPTS
jgi:hypothetical protein